MTQTPRSRTPDPKPLKALNPKNPQKPTKSSEPRKAHNLSIPRPVGAPAPGPVPVSAGLKYEGTIRVVAGEKLLSLGKPWLFQGSRGLGFRV